MSTTTSEFLRHLRTLTARQAIGSLSDQQLLERFRLERSEASFAVLVQRHGPMVLSVCRRVLHNLQDVEDAFQATFLVLAKKAATLRQPPLLSGWLHGVAYHVALRLKAKTQRRTVHEQRVDPLSSSDAMDDITWRELRSVLDEELQRLPERYRAPLVLCYLEARTQDEAAQRLGWSKNTFGRRMNQARQMLARRLTRRGLTLPAALTAPLLIDGAAQAALPPLLVSSTVRAGLDSATGQAMDALVSAQVAALAEGGVGSLLAKKASIAVVVLVSLMLGVGGLLAHRTLHSRTFAEARPVPPAPATQSPPARSASKDRAIEIKGHVLDPDGKPLAGARLLLRSENAAQKAGTSVRATTDKDGHFRFKATAADFGPHGKTTLAAAAQGFGPDWIEITAEHRNDLTLRLVKDDVSIEGRVLDLEGKPIAGVTIEVHRLARKTKNEDLTSWLDQHMRPRGSFAWENGLQSVRADLLEVPITATTNVDGKLHLSGFGRERVLRLKIHGPTIEHRVFWAMTRKGPSKGLKPGDYGFYAAAFDMVVGPTKPIIGTVRDKNTGKPLAGMVIEDGGGKARAITDKNGRYRLLGVAKQSAYHLSAGGGKGRPYFDFSKHSIADTPGLEPLRVDFELERGIEVAGRLTDRVTGQPVRGTIHYFTPPDNPNRKDYTTLEGPTFLVSDWGETRPDGTFTVLTIPGPGVLVACLPEEVDRFALIDARTELRKMNIYSGPVDPTYAIVHINPDEKNPKSLRCDIALEPGHSLSGSIVGPDGRPLTGVHCAGLSSPRFFFAPVGVPRPGSQGLKSAQFTARSLDPRRPRAVVFFHPEKKLGKVVHLRGDEKIPFRVQLEALGAVEGRIIDANGKPLPGLQVTAHLNGQLPVKNDALSTDLFESGLAERMIVRTTTDAGGKFRIDGLLAGVPYLLQASEKRENEEAPVIHPVNVSNIESGKTKDLGDLKRKQVFGAASGK